MYRDVVIGVNGYGKYVVVGFDGNEVETKEMGIDELSNVNGVIVDGLSMFFNPKSIKPTLSSLKDNLYLIDKVDIVSVDGLGDRLLVQVSIDYYAEEGIKTEECEVFLLDSSIM